MTKQEAITKERIFITQYLEKEVLKQKNNINEYIFKKLNMYNEHDYSNFIENKTDKFLFCSFVNIEFHDSFLCKFTDDNHYIQEIFYPLLQELSKQELTRWYTSFTFDYDSIKKIKLVYLVHTPKYKTRNYTGDITYEEE